MDGCIWWGRPNKGSSLVPSTAPQVLWLSWSVTTTIRKWKAFLPRHGSWGFVPHLMHSGSTTYIMATWRVLTDRVNAHFVWLLGFQLNFSFLCLVFKLPLFSLHFFQLSIIALCFFFSNLLWFSSSFRILWLSFCILWLLPLRYVSLFLFPFLFYGIDRLCSVSDFFSVSGLLGLSSLFFCFLVFHG